MLCFPDSQKLVISRRTTRLRPRVSIPATTWTILRVYFDEHNPRANFDWWYLWTQFDPRAGFLFVEIWGRCGLVGNVSVGRACVFPFTTETVSGFAGRRIFAYFPDATSWRTWDYDETSFWIGRYSFDFTSFRRYSSDASNFCCSCPSQIWSISHFVLMVWSLGFGCLHQGCSGTDVTGRSFDCY